MHLLGDIIPPWEGTLRARQVCFATTCEAFTNELRGDVRFHSTMVHRLRVDNELIRSLIKVYPSTFPVFLFEYILLLLDAALHPL